MFSNWWGPSGDLSAIARSLKKQTAPPVDQNCNRATIVPDRGGGVAKLAAPAAAGLVLLPPTAAVLMYPKPSVVKPVTGSVVCVENGFVADGGFIPVRLNMLVNSARSSKLTFSPIRNRRPKLILSFGLR